MGVRIDPRSSLSVQLIHEANFGSERFDPFGPPLSRDIQGPLRFPGREADEVLLCPPVAEKPAACPADVHTCDAVRGPVAAYQRVQQMAEPTTRVVVREVAVPTTLPTHVAGSLLDVLA